jgi:UDP-N-acetylglucosamine:LPS N-acetylglucosamine transferase
MTPGLANKIAMRKATKICCNFPETLKYLPEGKAVLTGSPIRQELLLGNKAAGLDLCNFTTDKPIILVVGGSTGVIKSGRCKKLTCTVLQSEPNYKQWTIDLPSVVNKITILPCYRYTKTYYSQKHSKANTKTT